MRRTSSLYSIALTALLLAAGATIGQMEGCASRQRVIEERIMSADYVPGAPIAVKTRNGAVEIIADPSAGDVVHIVAKITCSGETEEDAHRRLGETTVVIERDANNALKVSAEFPGTPRGGDGASFTIRLPDAAGVEVHTSNGRIHLSGLAGDATLHSSNGAIRILDHQGSADISTSNGRITVERLTGNLVAKTSNGAVEVSALAGSADLKSSNGSINVALQENQRGPIKAHTSNGSIRAAVGSAFAGEVKFETSNGKIKISDAAGRVKSQKIVKTSGVAIVGEGGVGSVLDTSNGNIEFEIR